MSLEHARATWGALHGLRLPVQRHAIEPPGRAVRALARLRVVTTFRLPSSTEGVRRMRVASQWQWWSPSGKEPPADKEQPVTKPGSCRHGASCLYSLCACPPTRACCVRACACCWIVSGLLLIIVVAVGLRLEADAVARAPDTAALYEVAEVCGRSVDGTAFRSFPNRSMTHATVGWAVAHCGPCGGCSTESDLALYHATASTLTRTTTRCALRALTGGRSAVRSCFDNDIGFSPSCSPCWEENVLCDQKLCLFTCLLGLVRGEPNNREVGPGELSPCLQCDERRCGTAFLLCAGANRRRSGITSDIGRLDSQVCNLTAR